MWANKSEMNNHLANDDDDVDDGQVRILNALKPGGHFRIDKVKLKGSKKILRHLCFNEIISKYN